MTSGRLPTLRRGALLGALLLAPASTGSAAPAPAAQDGLWLAVTESGVTVEVEAAQREAIAPGGLEVPTPFGWYRCPTDPVKLVEDARDRLDRALAQRQATRPDWEAWLETTADHGMLTEMRDALVQLQQQREDDDSPELIEVERALVWRMEGWGAQIDPAPARYSVEKRLKWLWSTLGQRRDPSALYLGGRLIEEVLATETVSSTRQIGIADLRRGLRDRSPWLRRTALRLAGKQKNYDLGHDVAGASIDPELGALERDAAAWSAQAIGPHDAVQWWIEALARGRGVERLAAAQALGRYGGETAVHGLIVALSAHAHRPPRRYRLGDWQIQVVSDSSRVDPSIYFGLTDGQSDYLANRSVVKVGKLDEALQRALLAALEEWSGKSTERDAEAWLAWYRAEVLKEAVDTQA